MEYHFITAQDQAAILRARALAAETDHYNASIAHAVASGLPKGEGNVDQFEREMASAEAHRDVVLGALDALPEAAKIVPLSAPLASGDQ